MKKILVLLIAGLIFGAVSREVKPNRQSHLYYGEVIATGSAGYIEDTFYNIGTFSDLDFKVINISAGSITTASITHIEYRNNDLMPSVSTNVLTSGTAKTVFEGNALTYRIYNPSANAKTTVTLNIRIK